jgi:hypothetical protein
MLPPNAPNFQVNIYKIYGKGERGITLLAMVQSDQEDAITLSHMLLEAHGDKIIVFSPWSWYTGLSLDKNIL